VLSLVPSGEGGSAVEVRSANGEALRGELLVDWLGAGEEILASERRPALGPVVEIDLPRVEEAAGVSVYFWDEASGRDGVGRLDLARGSDGEAVLDGPG
jgi:hypothetical protein